jgi:hypothetical protein
LAGNNYNLAVGPIATGQLSQAIYYASNIKTATAGANTVTVTFTVAAAYPDVRILEYSGIATSTPLVAETQGSGTGTVSNSGALTISNPTDLLVGANTVSSLTAGSDTGFVQRMLTNPDGDIVEDQIATKAGSYTASPALTSSGNWVAQLVAFRAATASGSQTTASVTLDWNANTSTGNPATDPAGYRLHVGTASNTYTQNIDAGNSTSLTVSNLVGGTTYYFAATAYNAAKVESPPSNAVSFTAP